MMPVGVLILLMGLILVMLILKPELGIQFKTFTEKWAFDAEWRPLKTTRWRFVVAGVFIEILFLGLLVAVLLEWK
jgi:hypothetical protein